MRKIKSAIIILAVAVLVVGCATKQERQLASLAQGVSEHNELAEPKTSKMPPKDLAFELDSKTIGSLLKNLDGVEYRVLEPYLPRPTVRHWPDGSRTILSSWSEGGYRTLAIVISENGMVESFLFNPPLKTEASSAVPVSATASNR